MVGIAFKSVLLLGVAWIAAWLLRKHSAASRHMVWSIACTALVALPLLTIGVPSIAVPEASAWMPVSVTFVDTTTATSTPTAAPRAIPTSSATVTTPGPASRIDWRGVLLRLWIAGAAIALAQMIFAWIAVWRLRRSATRIEELSEEVDVLETRGISMPMTFGWWKPAVILPAEARGWSDEHRRMVLLHEFAHVARRDLDWQLIARTALCLYWWNPMAWFAWRAFVREREQAADDIVLNAGARASDYAALLLTMASVRQTSAVWDAAATAMAQRNQLEGRLMKILDSTVNRNVPRRAVASAAGACALLLVTSLAALKAQDGLPADVEALIRTAAAQKNHQMLDDAAKAAEGTLKYNIARALLESSLAVRAQESSAEQGAGLLKLAQLERRTGSAEKAEALYRKVLATVPEGPDAAAALVDLGIIALTKKDAVTAASNFEKAQAVSGDHGGAALMWQAVIHEHQNEFADAESLYQRAAADTISPDAVTRLEMYAQFLSRRGRTDEASPIFEQATAMRKSAAASFAPSAGAYRIGGDITRPVLVSRIEPQYTDEARLALYQTTAIFMAEIGTDGQPHNLHIVRGAGMGLDEKAIEAVSQWRFEPGTKDGQPVTVVANIEINWRLL